MARTCAGLLNMKGWLVAASPLHVGGIGGDADTDLALAEDGLGRLLVGGSSLAGALRAWCDGRSPGSEPVKALWGTVTERRRGAGALDVDDSGFASRITCDDGLIFASLEVARASWDDNRPALAIDLSGSVERRDSVGIDRHTGAAAGEILNSRAIVPRDVAIRLGLRLEVGRDDLAGARAWLRAMLGALLAGEVNLGAATTRGLGRVALDRDSLRVRHLRLDERAAFLDGLATGGIDITDELLADTGEGAAPAGLPPRRRRLVALVDWEPANPVMVRAGLDGFYVDSLPLVTGSLNGRDEVATLVIPGASAKGSLRSRAELIVRTVLALDAPTPDGGHDRFLRQLDQLSIVASLFGWAPQSGEEPADRATFGRGALSVDDCYARSEPLTATEWRALVAQPEPAPEGARVERARMPKALVESLNRKGFRQADHVAIDRWTGGAADGALFSVLEPSKVAWQPMRLSLDLDRLATGDRDPAIGLFAIVLDELRAGRVPLGHGANRGLGWVRVTGVRLSGLPELAGAGTVVAGSDAFGRWETEALGRWRDWVAQQLDTALDGGRG